MTWSSLCLSDLKTQMDHTVDIFFDNSAIIGYPFWLFHNEECQWNSWMTRIVKAAPRSFVIGSAAINCILRAGFRDLHVCG